MLHYIHTIKLVVNSTPIFFGYSLLKLYMVIWIGVHYNQYSVNQLTQNSNSAKNNPNKDIITFSDPFWEQAN